MYIYIYTKASPKAVNWINLFSPRNNKSEKEEEEKKKKKIAMKTTTKRTEIINSEPIHEEKNPKID